jgi:putative ABC transport system substrate-binding protein
MPVIGFLHPASLDAQEMFVAGLRGSLSESAYVEGRNVSILYRWAEGNAARLPALAEDLARRQVAVIVAGATPAALAAKAATRTIPVVFVLGSDPVGIGLVASLNRPGGNLTGVTNLANALVAKRLNLLDQLKPGSGPLGMMVNPNNPNAEADLKEAIAAATALGRRLLVARVAGENDLESAFAYLSSEQAEALLVDVDPSFTGWRDRIVGLAAHHAMPASYAAPEFFAAGGLMSYEASALDVARQVGIYTARILKGEKPGDLPVQQPTKFELLINLKTAKALGLVVPPSLLAIADEVIE